MTSWGPRADLKSPPQTIHEWHSHRSASQAPQAAQIRQLVPSFCNAATHSTRLRERDHERSSLSGKERPCSAALRMRTMTAHYMAGC